ncbi:unnamed protein product [Peronospora belbahrii]|uniref:FYVE-type domain-containing protein n=1 Tax=Peronospora belbahrii TaxID=622444 RepID=A0AAU9LGF7_9STRA|nr:unnamed protein product [Peronospora belbahrii]
MKPVRLKRQHQVSAANDCGFESPLTYEDLLAAPLAAVKLAEGGDFPRLLMTLALRPRLARDTDAFGMTALHWVCSKPTVSPRVVLTVARAHPAAATTRNLAGLLPLHLAVRKRLVLEAIQALLHVYPQAIDVRTPDGKTSLMLAKQRPTASSAVLTLLEVLEAHTRTELPSSVMLPTSQWPASKPKMKKKQQQQLQKYWNREKENMRMSDGFRPSRSSTQEETLAAMMAPHVPPPRWELASRCRLCAATFGYFRTRHHCRNCGASVCGRHSRHRVPLKHLGLCQPQRVCECCFGELQNQFNMRNVEHAMRMGETYPSIDNRESNSIYSTNSMSLRARYRLRSKSVYSEPAQRQGSTRWRYDCDNNDSEATTNGFTPVSTLRNWNTASSEVVESLQSNIGSMFASVASKQQTVLDCRPVLREQHEHSIVLETARRRSRQERSRPHSSALDKSLHVQRLSEVEKEDDKKEMNQRMQQLAAAKRELGEVMWHDEENNSQARREKLEQDTVVTKYRRDENSSPQEDEDEDEEAEIAATFAFLNGGRRMSCTADLLGEFDPPLHVASVHHKLGEILLNKGDFTGAVVELRRSVELGNSNAVAWLYLAKALDGLGTDSKAAEEAVRRALELDPASIGALSLLGKLLHLRGDHDDAILVFREALKLQCPTGNLPGHIVENGTNSSSVTM